MRFFVLFICCALSFSASAQFWKRFQKHKVYPRYAQLPVATCTAAIPTVVIAAQTPQLCAFNLSQSTFEIEAQEDRVMTEAKHNMRFRIYGQASYNFSELAALYLLQNRFSEAKWYLLQSNSIAREENDDKHTIANLLVLATLKVAIGENALAKMDLAEAHNIAASKSMLADITEIEKRQHELQLNKPLAEKPEFRYAEAVELANKSQ